MDRFHSDGPFWFNMSRFIYVANLTSWIVNMIVVTHGACGTVEVENCV